MDKFEEIGRNLDEELDSAAKIRGRRSCPETEKRTAHFPARSFGKADGSRRLAGRAARLAPRTVAAERARRVSRGPS